MKIAIAISPARPRPPSGSAPPPPIIRDQLAFNTPNPSAHLVTVGLL
jgi:hypothetical protein